MDHLLFFFLDFLNMDFLKTYRRRPRLARFTFVEDDPEEYCSRFCFRIFRSWSYLALGVEIRSLAALWAENWPPAVPVPALRGCRPVSGIRRGAQYTRYRLDLLQRAGGLWPPLPPLLYLKETLDHSRGSPYLPHLTKCESGGRRRSSTEQYGAAAGQLVF